MEREKIDKLIDTYTEKMMEAFGLSEEQEAHVAAILAGFMAEVINETTKDLQKLILESTMDELKKQGLLSD